MTLRFVAPALYLIKASDYTSTALKLADGSVSLDESALPWSTAQATVQGVTAAQYELLAPGRTDYFISAEVDGITSEPRGAVQMVVTERSRSAFGDVQLVLASADIRLSTYSPATVLTAAKGMQSNVWDIWRFVHNQVFGASGWKQTATDLINGPSALTIPFPTYREATNLVANPSFEYGTTGWTATRSTIRTQSWTGGLAPNMGTNTLRVEGSGSNADTFAATPVNLQPNTTYTMSGWVLNGAVQNSAHTYARRLLIVATVNGTAFVLAQTGQGANTANGITRVSATFTTPAMMDPTGATLRVYNGTTTGSSNPVLWDGLMIVEGDGKDTDGVTPIPFFDGDKTNGVGGYNYAWQGDAGNSASTRTPIIDRDPDVLTWSPGQSAYDFLTPILQASGLRSFSYPLFTPLSGTSNYVPTFVLADNQAVVNQQPLFASSGVNLYSSRVLASLTAEFSDGTPMFADAVTIKYTWTDVLGVEQTAFDSYAPSGYTKPYVLSLDVPFPGAGRAKYLWARLSARRQMLEVVVPLNGQVLPGSQVIVTDPYSVGATPVVAYAEKIDHDWTACTTTIRTKAAIDYPSWGWLRLPAGEAWTASPTGASWTAETIS